MVHITGREGWAGRAWLGSGAWLQGGQGRVEEGEALQPPILSTTDILH